MDKLLRYIWLSLACTPGAQTFRNIINNTDDPIEVFDMEKEEIKSIIGSRSKDLTALADKDISCAKAIFDFCRAKNIGLLPYFSDKYPDSLRQIKNPPVLLYYRGVLPDFEKTTRIAVVGTRNISAYGQKNAFSLTYDLARAGAVIVSGMAIGVDGVAHAAALSAGGITLAVLGSGIDVCYPKQHKTLARGIVKQGCILTEYPPGTKPHKYNFPCRNRIISGISSATALIEGSAHSGALITARIAIEQGRLIYALPGNVGNKNSEASSILIKDGAKLLTGAEDIITDIPSLNPFNLASRISVDTLSAIKEYGVSAFSTGGRYNEKPMVISELPELEYSANGSAVPDNAEEELRRAEERDRLLSAFDKKAVSVYKKIPPHDECSVESLVDGECSLREVMNSLFKLEVAKFVTMLPGDRVKRSF